MIFTIGHSNHTTEEFIELLAKHSINYVCDVRSTPYSRFAEDYNRENIKMVLIKNNLQYLFFGEEFGARREEKSLYTDGIVDFEKVAKSIKFLEGMERIESGLNKGYRIALMCTEKEPIQCHRAILVSRNLSNKGIEVSHIMPDGSLVEHKSLELELVDKYFPNRNQISLFDLNEPIDYINESYKKANYEIGYIEGGEEK